MASATSQKPMELEGSLRTFKMADILRFLAMGAMSGTLTLSCDDRTIELHFKEGKLIGSGDDKRHAKLGQMLVHAGQLSRTDLEETLEQQLNVGRGGSTSLGKLLVERELVNEEQIAGAIELQTREELWEVFTWDEGTFKFEHGVPHGSECDLLQLDVEPLIDEGSERLEQWRTIAGNLGDTSEIYRIRDDIAGPPETPLNPNCWRVLSLVNGQRTVHALTFMSGLGRFETLCALDRLQSNGIIEPLDRSRGGRIIALNMDGCGLPGKPAVGTGSERPASDLDKKTNGATGGLRALLGIGRKGSPRTKDGTIPDSDIDHFQGKAGPFISSVGLGCALINQIHDAMIEQEAFASDESTVELLHETWMNELMRYPRADLIRPINGRLDAARYERYVELAGGVDKHLSGCQEDTMEMLAVIGATLIGRARQCLGKRADELIESILRPYQDPAEVSYPVDFIPRAWIEQWMKIA